jgi:hypothetical protein
MGGREMQVKIGMAFVEGYLDGLAARKLLLELDCAEPNLGIIAAEGGEQFWLKVEKYNQASKRLGPTLALVDLETAKCPSQLIMQNLPVREPDLLLRIAVRMLEAWLLADDVNLANFLRVRKTKIPSAPDEEIDPKRTIVNLARDSSSRDIRDDLVPPQGISHRVGKGYSARMADFIQNHWEPLSAAKRSPSLERAISAIRRRCFR